MVPVVRLLTAVLLVLAPSAPVAAAGAPPPAGLEPGGGAIPTATTDAVVPWLQGIVASSTASAGSLRAGA